MLGRRRSPDIDTVCAGYSRLLGRRPTAREMAKVRGALAGGATVGELLLATGRSAEYRARLIDELESGDTDDAAFLQAVYRRLFVRDIDPSGAAFYGRMLADGKSRRDLVQDLAGSDEHVNRVVAEAYPLPGLISRHGERYTQVVSRSGDAKVPCYKVSSSDDYAWIAEQIDRHSYYDRPGIWGYTVNGDKRVMAEIVARFSPANVLDLGCSNGTVMKCLHDLGVDVEGIELSSSAVRQAFPEIRDRIHVGSVTDLPRGRGFDVVIGLDIFEHVTPVQLAPIVASVYELIEPGGFLFANIPAFGDDPVFGTVFDIYLQPWVDTAGRREPFDLLHTDDDGFPLHGHLIWAATDWWQAQFTAVGFTRHPDIERAIHRRYDGFLRESAPSRLSFYVFGKDADPARVAAITDRIAADASPLPV